jgi:hypothetical protein
MDSRRYKFRMIDGYQKAIKLATIEIDLAITGGKLSDGGLKEFRNIQKYLYREASASVDRKDDLETLSRRMMAPRRSPSTMK